MSELRCANCSTTACRAEPGTVDLSSECPMATQSGLLLEVERLYRENEDARAIALAAARTEAAGYCVEPRVEEIMSFARRIGARRIGVASCIGLLREARLFCEILAANGFEPLSVCCKVGSIDKRRLGLEDREQIRPGAYEPLCNPVGQAALLDRAGAELNVAVGLCVGHDSLFFRHSLAPVTVLVAKDRVTGHNPAAALYTSHSYYRRLREPDGAGAENAGGPRRKTR
jgi:uncharacterized metal-binding protein